MTVTIAVDFSSAAALESIREACRDEGPATAARQSWMPVTIRVDDCLVFALADGRGRETPVIPLLARVEAALLRLGHEEGPVYIWNGDDELTMWRSGGLIHVSFKPSDPGCGATVEEWRAALEHAVEGVVAWLREQLPEVLDEPRVADWASPRDFLDDRTEWIDDFD